MLKNPRVIKIRDYLKPLFIDVSPGHPGQVNHVIIFLYLHVQIVSHPERVRAEIWPLFSEFVSIEEYAHTNRLKI